MIDDSTPSDELPIRERLFRECEAMLLYATGAGATRGTLEASLLGLLDRERESRGSVPLDQIVKLHDALAREIAPALPRTVEQMHWDKRQPSSLWRRVAPLRSLRMLILWTVILAALFLLGTLWVAGAETPGAAPVVVLYLYFAVLGGLGAAFAALYDSYNYLREGRYDDRLASTYTIRIGVGMFTGVLLAHALADYLGAEPGVDGDGAAASFSQGLLAFIGGFAAQLVYDLLNRIVDSIANMFRPDRRRERAVREREVAASAREQAGESDTRRKALLERVLIMAEAIADTAERERWTRQALSLALAGAQPEDLPERPGTGDGRPLEDLVVRVENAKQGLAAADEVSALLPEAERAALAARIGGAREALRQAGDALAAGDGGEARTRAGEALAAASAADPLPNVVADALGRMDAAAGGGRARRLALACLEAGRSLGGDAYRRWKVVAFGAPVWSVADLAARADAETLRTAAAGVDGLAGALSDAGGVERVRGLLRAGDRAALIEAMSAGDADPAAVEAGIETWLHAVVKAQCAADLARELPEGADGASVRDDVFAALDAVRDGDRAEAGHQLIGLIADRIRRGALPAGAVSALIRARIHQSGN